MKTALVVAANAIFSMAPAAFADECHSICGDVKKAVTFKSACSSFRNTLPRPKVARYCQDAFKEAIDGNCYDACDNGGNTQAFVAERRLDQTCKKALTENPRPLCHDACVKGYRSGIEDMSISLSKRMAQSNLSSLTPLRENTTSRKSAQAAHSAAADAIAGMHKARREAPVASTQDRSRGDEPDQLSAPQELDAEQNVGQEMEAQRQHIEASAAKSTKFADEQLIHPAIDERARDVSVAEAPGNKHGFQGGLVLSLPITVDGIEKELDIFEGDEPMDVIAVFCEESMPAEGSACADQLLLVVQDKLAKYENANTLSV